MTDPKTDPTALPIIPSGTEIYDSIMAKIEPELCSNMDQKLKEKYKDETPAQWEARKKRYNTAFKKFNEEYQTYIANLNQSIHHYHKTAVRRMEMDNHQDEERMLTSITNAMSDIS